MPLAASPAPIAHTIGKFLCIMHFALLLLVDGRWCIAISYLCLIISAGVSESISQDITISSSVLLKSDDLNRYTTKGNAGILYYYTILLCCHVIRGRFWREPRAHLCVFIGNGSNFTTCGSCKFQKNSNFRLLFCDSVNRSIVVCRLIDILFRGMRSDTLDNNCWKWRYDTRVTFSSALLFFFFLQRRRKKINIFPMKNQCDSHFKKRISSPVGSHRLRNGWMSPSPSSKGAFA